MDLHQFVATYDLNRSSKEVSNNATFFSCSAPIMLPLVCDSATSDMMTATEILYPLVGAKEAGNL